MRIELEHKLRRAPPPPPLHHPRPPKTSESVKRTKLPWRIYEIQLEIYDL